MSRSPARIVCFKLNLSSTNSSLTNKFVGSLVKFTTFSIMSDIIYALFLPFYELLNDDL